MEEDVLVVEEACIIELQLDLEEIKGAYIKVEFVNV
jgi:hypothetical protein